MIGVIQKREFTKNGAPKFQISGSWYFLNRGCEPQSFEPGTSVEFEWSEFGDDRGRGKPKAISRWRAAPEGNSATSQTTSTVTDVDILRSVSNVVGSACAAGTIKDPLELEKWMAAAWGGFLARGKPLQQRDEPEFNDDLPPESPRNNGSNW